MTRLENSTLEKAFKQMAISKKESKKLVKEGKSPLWGTHYIEAVADKCKINREEASVLVSWWFSNNHNHGGSVKRMAKAYEAEQMKIAVRKMKMFLKGKRRGHSNN